MADSSYSKSAARIVALAILVASVMLAGCGRSTGKNIQAEAKQTGSTMPASTQPSEPSETSEASESTAPSEETTTTESTASEDAATVTFHVEGGYAGLIRNLTIKPDGSALIEISGRESSADLDADAVAQLVAALDASQLFAEDGVYQADGADLQQYTIVYQGVTVVAYDGAVPLELVEAIETMEAMILDNRGL